MTNEQINIAIAEHLGAKPFVYQFTGIDEDGEYLSEHRTIEGARAARDSEMDGPILPKYCGPNYCGDLNAMHSAEIREGARNPDFWTQYLDSKLPEICEEQDAPPECATALQRAKAFLKAVGKWQSR